MWRGLVVRVWVHHELRIGRTEWEGMAHVSGRDVATHGFDLFHLFFREVQFSLLPQPVFRQFFAKRLECRFNTFEMRGEYSIEAIELRLVLNEAGASNVVEIFDTLTGDAALHRFEQRQQLGDRRLHAALA